MAQERRRIKVIWEREALPSGLSVTHEAFTPNSQSTSTGVPGPINPFSAVRPSMDLHGEGSGLLKSMQNYGVPRVEGAISPKQEAIELLRVAAEIEHALMVEYLYAWLSIKEGSSFQSGIRKVALQEMGHLMSVQNLAMVLDAPPYFARQDASPQPEIDPFPFSLRPLDIYMLAKAVAAEMPSIDDVPDADKALVKTIQELAKCVVGDEVNRVGVLYAKIYWLFQSSDNPEGPLHFSPEEAAELRAHSVAGHIADGDFADPADIAAKQANIEEFPNLGAVQLTIETPAERATCLQAIFNVMEEGEGAISGGESHFGEFLDLYKTYGSTPPTIHKILVNPTSSDYPEGSTLRAFSDLSNLRYELMLMDFTLWLSTARTEENGLAIRERAAAWSLAEMRFGITRLTGSLLKRQIDTSDVAGTVGSPPFALPNLAMPNEFKEHLERMKTLVSRADALIADIEAKGNLDSSEEEMLVVFKSIDADRTEFINEHSALG